MSETTITVPAWLKAGAIVRFKPLNTIVEVRDVTEGGIDARKARSNRLDVLHQPASMFAPATIEERLLFVLDRARIDEIRSILPDGQDERQYRVVFRDRLTTAVIDKIKPLVDKVDSAENPALVLTVPQSWLDDLSPVDPVTPPLLAMAQVEAAAAKQTAQADYQHKFADPAVIDYLTRRFTAAGQDLSGAKILPSHRLGRSVGQDSTYAVIFDRANQMAVSALDLKRVGFVDPVLNGTTITVDLPPGWDSAPETQAADLTETTGPESAETAPATLTAAVCKEVVTRRNISDAEFQKFLNEHYSVLHIQFAVDNTLNVVFVREVQPSPATFQSRTTVTRQASMVMFPEKGTPPRRYEEIAKDRATLNALLDDTGLPHGEFYNLVINSRLPRDEQEALILQSRNTRTRRDIEAQMERMPRPAYRPSFVTLPAGE